MFDLTSQMLTSQIAIPKIMPMDVAVEMESEPDVDKYRTSATGENVAAYLLELFLSLSRCPVEIQSDNGSQFTCACVK